MVFYCQVFGVLFYDVIFDDRCYLLCDELIYY
jgi:hypothetical protein